MDPIKRIEILEYEVKALEAQVASLKNTLEIIRTAIPTLRTFEVMMEEVVEKRFPGNKLRNQDNPVENRRHADEVQGNGNENQVTLAGANTMETPSHTSDDDIVEILPENHLLDPMDSQPSSSRGFQREVIAEQSVFPKVATGNDATKTTEDEDMDDDIDDSFDYELFRPSNPIPALNENMDYTADVGAEKVVRDANDDIDPNLFRRPNPIPTLGENMEYEEVVEIKKEIDCDSFPPLDENTAAGAEEMVEEVKNDVNDEINYNAFRVTTNPNPALDKKIASKIPIDASEDKSKNDSEKNLKRKTVIDPDGRAREIIGFFDLCEEEDNLRDKSSQAKVKGGKETPSSSSIIQPGNIVNDGQVPGASGGQNIESSDEEFITYNPAVRPRIILKKKESKYDFDLYN